MALVVHLDDAARELCRDCVPPALASGCRTRGGVELLHELVASPVADSALLERRALALRQLRAVGGLDELSAGLNRLAATSSDTAAAQGSTGQEETLSTAAELWRAILALSACAFGPFLAAATTFFIARSWLLAATGLMLTPRLLAKVVYLVIFSSDVPLVLWAGLALTPLVLWAGDLSHAFSRFSRLLASLLGGLRATASANEAIAECSRLCSEYWPPAGAAFLPCPPDEADPLRKVHVLDAMLAVIQWRDSCGGACEPRFRQAGCRLRVVPPRGRGLRVDLGNPLVCDPGERFPGPDLVRAAMLAQSIATAPARSYSGPILRRVSANPCSRADEVLRALASTCGEAGSLDLLILRGDSPELPPDEAHALWIACARGARALVVAQCSAHWRPPRWVRDAKLFSGRCVSRGCPGALRAMLSEGGDGGAEARGPAETAVLAAALRLLERSFSGVHAA
jgi:hypothetical protein